MARSATNIGKNLKALLDESKISQSALSRATGVSPQTISKCILGVQGLYCSTLMVFAEYFEVPTDYFFEDNS